MIYRIILIIIFINCPVYAFQKHPELNTQGDYEKIEERLQKERIIVTSLFKHSEGVQPTHKILMVTLESGLQALFKSGEYHYAEVAGYRLSKLLNVLFVPPTVFRTIEGTQGSLQLYIQAPNLASRSNRTQLLKILGEEVINQVKLFYYVAGQWDTHYGNQLIEQVGGKYRLWLIDNSSMLHRSYSNYGGITFIEKGINSKIYSSFSTQFPFEEATTIQGKNAAKVLSPFISSKQHLQSLLQHEELTYIIWRSTLWLGHPTEGHTRFGRYATKKSSKLLSLSTRLTRESLSEIWAEWLIVEPICADELIDLTLYRRDELIQYYSPTGSF